MLFSMLAWVLRFGLFAFGNPADGLWMIVLSCIVYGMAFDFFNISGSLFIETQTTPEIRGSAQGLFMMMVNGFGAVFGSLASGAIIDKFFTLPGDEYNWQGIWLCFAVYALVIAIIFPFVFRYKHNAALERAIQNVQH
jgi:NHS family xanthosine MFS transporter